MRDVGRWHFVRHSLALMLATLLTGSLHHSPAQAHDGPCVETSDHTCISKAERAELQTDMIPRRVRTIVGGQPEKKQKDAPACTCPGAKRLSYTYDRLGSEGHVRVIFRPGKKAGTWRLERTDTVA